MFNLNLTMRKQLEIQNVRDYLRKLVGTLQKFSVMKNRSKNKMRGDCFKPKETKETR